MLRTCLLRRVLIETRRDEGGARVFRHYDTVQKNSLTFTDSFMYLGSFGIFATDIKKGKRERKYKYKFQ
jgi:hypothetical protein